MPIKPYAERAQSSALFLFALKMCFGSLVRLFFLYQNVEQITY